jgi:hypothetical protein
LNLCNQLIRGMNKSGPEMRQIRRWHYGRH